jgi:hypothetical protein
LRREQEIQDFLNQPSLNFGRVLLTTSFAFSDFKDFMDPEFEEWDEEDPHSLLDWLHYCIEDTSATLFQSYEREADLRPFLTVTRYATLASTTWCKS